MAQDTVVIAPATHSQPSRKSKRAWRKNINLDTIQSGLEDLQDAKIVHGNVLPAEKDASELFATDIVGDDDLFRKQQRGKKLLKAEEILALRSKVPGLDGRKRKAEEKAAGTRSSKKARNGTYVTHKDLQRLRQVADGKRLEIEASDGATHDPWAVVPDTRDPHDFIEAGRPKQKREPKTLKQAPLPLTESGKHVAHVRIPDAGKSYNPLVGDWSALLQREGEAAVEAEQKRLHAEAVIAEREAKAAEEAAKVEAAEKDLYATDYDSAWESEWDGFLSGAEEESYTQKQVARKTQPERNKIKARKEREALEVHQKKLKAREHQERQIEQIAKEVSAKDKARQSHVRALQIVDSSDSDNGHEVALKKRRTAKLAVPKAPLEVVLPEDLEDSLRRLKPEGDLLQERYRNLLVNGKLEVRKKVGQVKQPKTTRTEKWSYKDWTLK